MAWHSKGDAASGDAVLSGNPLFFQMNHGTEVCGRIVAVDKDIDAARIGERVSIEPCLREAQGEILEKPLCFGSECDGSFAQYACVAARHAYPVNGRPGDTELAPFPCSCPAAENMLTRSRVRSQDTVFVTGASGGVGSAAVQHACARGVRVIAVTGASGAESLKQPGASRTPDPRSPCTHVAATPSLILAIRITCLS